VGRAGHPEDVAERAHLPQAPRNGVTASLTDGSLDASIYNPITPDRRK
jgi:hypothetical protein